MTSLGLSDTDVEDWFERHGKETQGVTEAVLLSIAPWIPLIGIPANAGCTLPSYSKA